MTTVKHKHLEHTWQTFVQNGGEESFYQIYQHYHHYLGYIGLKRGFALERAQDVINDVFLYLWENKTKISHIINHHNYIVTIFLRKLFKDDQAFLAQAVDVLEVSESIAMPSVEEVFIQQHTDDLVEEYLKNSVHELGEKQKLLIYQKFYLGLSYEEIAQVNGQSIHTVYNTIYKSVDKLRKLLTTEQEMFLKIAIGTLSTFFLIFL